MKPRNGPEWIHVISAFQCIGIGLMMFLVYGEVGGLAVIAVGLFSYALYYSWRIRYLAGWMEGRGQMMGLLVETSKRIELPEEERRSNFVEAIIETDIIMMRRQVGDRQTEKFLQHAVQHFARSDGSHDNLP